MSSERINISIVVNGTPHPEKIGLDEPFLQVVQRVLKETKNVGQPIQNWELRTASGEKVEFNTTAEIQGIREYDQLFLSLKAGIGGN